MVRILFTFILFTLSLVSSFTVQAQFVQDQDLISLHYDHAPDRDDGHATVAALAVVRSRGIVPHVVSGAHGTGNADQYVPAAEVVMRAAWGSAWEDANGNRQAAVNATSARWLNTLLNGGDIWVAEGGQSDFTTAVVRSINTSNPGINTRTRIHVVQHSRFNESNSNQSDLRFSQANTDYILINDGNDDNGTADLNMRSDSFVQLARNSQFGSAWNAAFSYLNPNVKLDFSDTVLLLHILGIGRDQIATVDDFGAIFLDQSPENDTPDQSPENVTPDQTPDGDTQDQSPTPNPDLQPVSQNPPNQFPACSSPAVDPDGDGFGFENNQSCIVQGATTPAQSDDAPESGPQPGFPVCSSGDTDPDGDGFGFENNQSCIVQAADDNAATIANGQPDFPVCSSSDSDSDGDGFGFENNQSCIVQAADDNAAPIANDQPDFPVCSSSDSDSDGDGFGFENNQSCIVQAADDNAAPIANDQPDFPDCSSSDSDSDGDGFGFENNQSCVVR